jgi:hypothetical protein
VSLPGVLAGGVGVTTDSYVIGADANFRHALACGCDYRLDSLVGYRFLGLNERLSVRERLIATDPAAPVPAGTLLEVFDSFKTANQFHGGQIGLAGERRFGRLFVDAYGKVAFGVTYSTITIDGATRITPPGGAPVTAPGGLLAQRTNIGRYSRDEFAVLPEGGLRLGYALTQNVRLFGGYNFLYLSSVARPGSQIDLAVNPTQLPPGRLAGQPRPAFADGHDDVWVQGVSGGIEFRY